jgi:hypothetical protein
MFSSCEAGYIRGGGKALWKLFFICSHNTMSSYSSCGPPFISKLNLFLRNSSVCYMVMPNTANNDSTIHDWTMQPIVPDYAHRPIEEGFNWELILKTLLTANNLDADRSLYLVVFRSQHFPDADRELLRQHDERAHTEAKQSPSLLYYFGGTPDKDGYCVSFCLWTHAESARAATSDGSHHKAAVSLANRMYSYFRLERYDICLRNNVVNITPCEPAH